MSSEHWTVLLLLSGEDFQLGSSE